VSTVQQLETKREGLTLYCADALELLAHLEPASVDLIVADGPYFRVRTEEAWDTCFPSSEAFLEWKGQVYAAMRRVLKPNGSLYDFASPDMAGRVEVACREHFNVLNVIRWEKDAGWHQKTDEETLRSYLSPWEGIIFAEQVGSGRDHTLAEDRLRGFLFEPIRAYLDGERQRAGVTFEEVREMVGCAPGSGLPSHWFTPAQWMLPTEEQYCKLQRGFNERFLRRPYTELRGEYQVLQREYEALRTEYEALRRPFSASPDRPYFDRWTFATVPPYPGKHGCEKPQALLRHIVETSSRPGDVVLDPFHGSGSTGEAALSLGRRFIGGEASEHWSQYAAARLERRFGGLPQTPARPRAPRRASAGQGTLWGGAA
jgi:adenine-specific DNA-methyltransferase